MSLFAINCAQKLSEGWNQFHFIVELACLSSIQGKPWENWEVEEVEYFRAASCQKAL